MYHIEVLQKHTNVFGSFVVAAAATGAVAAVVCDSFYKRTVKTMTHQDIRKLIVLIGNKSKIHSRRH